MFGLGWSPFRWRKQFVQVESAQEFIVEFNNELPPVAAFGTGTPPIAQMSAFPLGGAIPIAVGVVPTGVGMVHGQFDLTGLIDPPVG